MSWKNFLAQTRQGFRILLGAEDTWIAPQVLFQFNDVKAVQRFKVYSDSSFGGSSTAVFGLNKASDAAIFSGTYSTELGPDADVVRAGYCGITSKVLRANSYYNLEQYDALVYTVKGDGQKYIANLRVGGMFPDGGDIWQAPFQPRSGEWEQVYIPFEAFAPSRGGRLLARKLPLARTNILSFGIAITATTDTKVPSQFVLEIRDVGAAGHAQERSID